MISVRCAVQNSAYSLRDDGRILVRERDCTEIARKIYRQTDTNTD